MNTKASQYVLKIIIPPRAPYVPAPFRDRCIEESISAVNSGESFNPDPFLQIVSFEEEELNRLRDTESASYKQIQSDLGWIAQQVNANIHVFIGHIEDCLESLQYLEDQGLNTRAENGLPTLFILIGCHSAELATKYTLGDASANWRKNGFLFFGFSPLMHIYKGKIYGCKEGFQTNMNFDCFWDQSALQDKKNYNAGTRTKAEENYLVDCCEQKDARFKHRFLEAFAGRKCMEYTKEIIAEKAKAALAKADALETADLVFTEEEGVKCTKDRKCGDPDEYKDSYNEQTLYAYYDKVSRFQGYIEEMRKDFYEEAEPRYTKILDDIRHTSPQGINFMFSLIPYTTDRELRKIPYLFEYLLSMPKDTAGLPIETKKSLYEKYIQLKLALFHQGVQLDSILYYTMNVVNYMVFYSNDHRLTDDEIYILCYVLYDFDPNLFQQKTEDHHGVELSTFLNAIKWGCAPMVDFCLRFMKECTDFSRFYDPANEEYKILQNLLIRSIYAPKSAEILTSLILFGLKISTEMIGLFLANDYPPYESKWEVLEALFLLNENEDLEGEDSILRAEIYKYRPLVEDKQAAEVYRNQLEAKVPKRKPYTYRRRRRYSYNSSGYSNSNSNNNDYYNHQEPNYKGRDLLKYKLPSYLLNLEHDNRAYLEKLQEFWKLRQVNPDPDLEATRKKDLKALWNSRGQRAFHGILDMENWLFEVLQKEKQLIRKGFLLGELKEKQKEREAVMRKLYDEVDDYIKHKLPQPKTEEERKALGKEELKQYSKQLRERNEKFRKVFINLMKRKDTNAVKAYKEMQEAFTKLKAGTLTGGGRGYRGWSTRNKRQGHFTVKLKQTRRR
jgi:hypothetical protein